MRPRCTTEADVSATIHAARNVLGALGALGGDADPWPQDAIDAALDAGDDLLGAHADALFGPVRPGRPTRIMITLASEAADQPARVRAMVEAGMDHARVSCAHDGPQAWARMTAHVRSAAREAGRQVLVSMDLPGRKLRTGGITDGPAVGRARVTRHCANERAPYVTHGILGEVTDPVTPSGGDLRQRDHHDRRAGRRARPTPLALDPGWVGPS